MVTTKEVKIIKRLPTCIVCGEAASERCGNCTDFASNYCSREHQRLNWRIHKRLCTVATNKFIRQPDLLRSESDFFSEIASLCGCGKPHGNLLSVLGKRDENHKSLRATNDEAAFVERTKELESVDETERNEVLSAIRSAFLENRPREFRIRMQDFITKENLSPFYRIAIIQDILRGWDTKIFQPSIKEFFTYFSLIVTVSDINEQEEYRNSSMSRLKKLVEPLKKKKVKGWERFYLQYRIIKDIHSDLAELKENADNSPFSHLWAHFSGYHPHSLAEDKESEEYEDEEGSD